MFYTPRISSPSGFIGAPVSGGTAGSVLFLGTGGILAQDNTNLFWDDTNNFLGIGTASPANRLHVRQTSNNVAGVYIVTGGGSASSGLTLEPSAGGGRSVSIGYDGSMIAMQANNAGASAFQIKGASSSVRIATDASGNIVDIEPNAVVTARASGSGNGTFKVKKGGTTSLINVGGVTVVDTTQTGNTAATETDAFSHSVAASTLGADGDSLRFMAAGTFAATASTDKRIKVVFGSDTLFDSGSIAVTTAKDWSLNGLIIRTGAATTKAIVNFQSSEATLTSTVDYTTGTPTLANANTLKLTINGTNASDVVAELYKEWFDPIQ